MKFGGVSNSAKLLPIAPKFQVIFQMDFLNFFFTLERNNNTLSSFYLFSSKLIVTLRTVATNINNTFK